MINDISQIMVVLVFFKPLLKNISPEGVNLNIYFGVIFTNRERATWTWDNWVIFSAVSNWFVWTRAL